MTDTLEVPSGAQSAGHFVPWEGGCLLIGRAVGIVPLHAHYATQISFGSHPGIRFRTGEEEWVDYAGAIVPSNRPHMMDATSVRMTAILFVEPETREGRVLSERYPPNAIAAVTEDVLGEARDALFAAWREHGPRQAVADAARTVIQVLIGGLEPSVVSDERILRAIAHIQSHLDAPLTLEMLAAEVFLSPGRFRHLFVEQTGMGLRPYILWRRFLRVWELAMAGETLSAAAHGAGFADSAHLTRTSRRMFGVPPSALQMVGPLSRG